MEIAVRTRDLECDADLNKVVERRVVYAVDRHKSRIDRISVCLSDLNGPRGGVDKLCHMTADVRGIGTVLISERGSDLFEAVANAARRLGFRIRKSIERRRESGAPHRRESIRIAR